jgi:hypothetical protein
MHIEQSILDKVNEWLTPVFDQETQEKIKEMMTSSPKDLEESFYKNLEFGTGGMRGIMGVGTNRINKYTLGKNTQGLSDYLKKSFPKEQLKVAIAYDCRHNSDTLGRIVADVFSANGIQVYLFSEMRPTPELSFTFGPILQVLVGQTPEISLSQTIISPDFMYFVQGAELVKTVTNSAEFTGFTKTRLGLDIAASYKVNLSHSWALLPRMGFQYILTKMAENGTTQDQNGNQIILAEDRALHSLQFGVGLLYYFH